MNILITGGCGFVGTNLADCFLKKGNQVLLFDNLSRKGVSKNLEWLKLTHKKGLKFTKGDVRNFDQIFSSVKDIDVIFHCSAQVAVTTSVKKPREDFEINALGTFNVLEAARQTNSNPIVVYTSTNKVYGDNVNKIPLTKKDTRYEFSDPNYENGVPENFPTDSNAHTPYGNSKYTADLYTRDYFAVYGLRTVVFRMSCIFGEHQQGCSDQGWLDFLIRRAVKNEPIRIYGDGCQVRDILHASDLVRAFELATENINKTKGKAYNIGGGPNNTISILELMNILKNKFKLNVNYSFDDWRPFDQKVYISDIRKAKEHFNWAPLISKEEGIKRQYEWIISSGI